MTPEQQKVDELVRKLQAVRGMHLTQEINDLWCDAIAAVCKLVDKKTGESDEQHRNRCTEITSRAVHGCR